METKIRKPYQPPTVTLALDLETRAGSLLTGSIDPWENLEK